MPKVREIEEFLFSIAPKYMKEDWDNVGHLCGRADAEVTRLLVSLDPFEAVIEEAKAAGAQLVVSHHPLIFGAAKSVTDADATGRALLSAIEGGVAVISMHTNLDSAPGGVNDCLAAALGLTDVGVLAPAGKDEAGREYGLGRVGTVPEQSLSEFAMLVKTALGCEGLRFADAGRPVRRVAVGGGACGEFMAQALALGCDTFVTSDIKYNGFIDARDFRLNLIDAGHYQTEQVVCPYLAAQLSAGFPALDVLLSKTRTDAAEWQA